jgi:hypothetical protein
MYNTLIRNMIVFMGFHQIKDLFSNGDFMITKFFLFMTKKIKKKVKKFSEFSKISKIYIFINFQA